MNDLQKELRKLPSVDKLLQRDEIKTLLQEHSHDLTVYTIQAVSYTHLTLPTKA